MPPAPVLSCEKARKGDIVDDAYTLDFGLAAEFLERSEDSVLQLVKISQMNARLGVYWPLKVMANGQSVTLLSVLAYRRRLRPKSLSS